MSAEGRVIYIEWLLGIVNAYYIIFDRWHSGKMLSTHGLSGGYWLYTTGREGQCLFFVPATIIH